MTEHERGTSANLLALLGAPTGHEQRVKVTHVVCNESHFSGVSIAMMLALSAWGCSGNMGSPASPSVGMSGSTPTLAASPFGGNAMPLVEVANSSPAGGAGMVNVTQTATPDTNNFEVEVTYTVVPLTRISTSADLTGRGTRRESS